MTYLKGAKAILDDEIHRHLTFNIGGGPKLFNDEEHMHVKADKDRFIQQYITWLNESTLFKIRGLKDFKHTYITLGNTQAIDDFYRLSNGRVYTFPGEYPYHKAFKENRRIKLTDMPINRPGPYIKNGSVLSYPFAATGNKPDKFEERMTFLDNTNVMLDLAYFGIYYSPAVLDLTKYPQVHSVAFSLSKIFCTGYMRVGIVMSKEEWDTPLKMANDWGYLPKLNMRIHSGLMKQFGPDYVYEKYRKKQLKLCKELDLTPSDTILFGLSDESDWDEYTRNGVINRVCLSIMLQN